MIYQTLLSWDMKKMVDQTLQVSSDGRTSDSYKDAKSLDEFHIETMTIQLDKREKTLKLFTNSIEKQKLCSESFIDLHDKFLEVGNLIQEVFTKWQRLKN